MRRSAKEKCHANPDGSEEPRAPDAPAIKIATAAPEPVGGATATLDPGQLDYRLIEDPELRRRLEMTAESDLEAFRFAYWRGTVTFHEVACAWFHMSDPNLPDDLRGEFKLLFPGLLDAFSEPRKGIVTAYFCRHIRVAAALTDIGYAAGAPEGVPEAELKGPPPPSIVPLLEQHEAESKRNGHADPRAPTHAWRRQRRREYDVSFWKRLLPGAPHLFDPAPAASSAIHIEPPSATPRTGRPRRSSSSASTCTTRRSSSSPRSRARSACG